MKVKVELVYDDATRNRELVVEVKDGLKGGRLMNAIDKAVMAGAASDKDWTRWNLLKIEEQETVAGAAKRGHRSGPTTSRS